MNRLPAAATLALVAISTSACRQQSPDTPPTVHLDDDMCAQCGMIISDERFACATIIEDDRGLPKPLLFDDLNCLANHQSANPGLTVLRRWVHDHATRTWLPAEDAVYLVSPDLPTPMASHAAAFESRASAEALQRDVGGDILTFEGVLPRLSP